MRKPLMVLLSASLLLAACGWRDTGLNPRNWFGNSREVAVEPASNTNPLIPRKPAQGKQREPIDTSVAIATLTELRINPSTTGAIILVTGVASRQGAYDAQLRLDQTNADDPTGTLSYTFRVNFPGSATPVGSERTRTINVARSVTNQDLRGIRLIRINGAQNLLETRRR